MAKAAADAPAPSSSGAVEAGPDPDADTIVALATPPGRGALGIVRLSGPRAFAIVEQLIAPIALPPPRRAGLRSLRDHNGATIDQAVVLGFAAGESFTGEQSVELHGHGSPFLLQAVVDACLHAGARAARPGEFSLRAYLNDRLDLAQAEAIADAIHAGTEAAARAAVRTLEGALSTEVKALATALMQARVLVESALDFSDEELPPLHADAVARRLGEMAEACARLLAAARHGTRLREGFTVVIAGRPNAGKSTLLNALAGREVAIVTPHAGTTRDILREALDLDGIPVQVLDTAGLRDTADPVEAIGIARAWAALGEQADLVLYLFDLTEGWTNADRALWARLPDPGTVPRLLVGTKADRTEGAMVGSAPPLDALTVNLHAPDGIRRVREALAARVGGEDPMIDTAAPFIARARHVEAIARAQTHLEAAGVLHAERTFPELVAEELRHAQQALAAVAGSDDTEDLLGAIFGTFCIGK